MVCNVLCKSEVGTEPADQARLKSSTVTGLMLGAILVATLLASPAAINSVLSYKIKTIQYNSIIKMIYIIYLVHIYIVYMCMYEGEMVFIFTFIYIIYKKVK